MCRLQNILDNFFNDGDGAQFASESALQDVISDLQTAKPKLKDTIQLSALQRIQLITSSAVVQASSLMTKTIWIKNRKGLARFCR